MPLLSNCRTQILSILLVLFASVHAQTSSKGLLHFDGTKDYIQIDNIADTISGLDDFTLEFWMQADQDSQSMLRTTFFAANRIVGDNRFLIVFGGTTGNTGNVIIYDDNSGGSKFDIISSVSVGDNVCHHIAYSKLGSKGTLYIDGVLIESHTADYQLSASDKYSIGQDWDYGGTVNSDFYRGNMRDFRLWDHARTKSEILNNINAELTGNETGLIVLYHMNEGSPGSNNTSITKVDDDASSLDGKLMGFTLTGWESNYVTYNCNDIAGIGQIENSNEFNIYPNPSEGILIINASGAIKEILISDMFGKIVQHSEEMSTKQLTLNLQHLPAGCYHIQILDEAGFVSNENIVII
ncbi:MAG: T9SS type A sorting domain-containing protein [Bacteroidia bacterium]